MKNSQSGFIAVSLAAKIIVAVALFFGGVFVTKKIVSHHSPSANEIALESEKSIAAKTGQQFAAATTKEVSLAKDQSDPAIVAARKTSARADVALATGLGQFTPEQAKWVQDLVEADAAGFTASLADKDAQLIQTGDKISNLEKKISDEQEHSGFLEKLLIAVGIGFVLINYVLPWLESIFPPLGIFTGAIHAVLNPFLASASAKVKQVFEEVGSAVSDMRAKLGANAAQAIQHLDNNLSNSNIAAVAAAAKDAAAKNAAEQAAAAAAVQIALN